MKKSSRNTFLSALSLAVAAGAVVVAAPVHADAAAKSFSDVPAGYEHHDAIMDLAGRGILQGYETGKFGPDDKLTRAHASKILAMSLGLNTDNVKDPGFKDLNKNQWHYKYVAALANAGYIEGFEDKTFRPNAPMTRAHTAKILDMSYKLPLEAKTANPFTDVSDNAWYVDHIRTLVENKVTKGKTATTFAPNANVTRAQMASFVVRSENFEVVANIVEATKSKIRDIVTESGVVETDGKKVAEANFDKDSGTLTMTAYNMDGGVDALQGLGLFSDKLPELGVSTIRVGNTDVDVSKDFGAAKQQLTDEMAKLLSAPSDTTNGDLVAKDVKVTLFGHSEDIEFWEYFNVNLNVFAE